MMDNGQDEFQRKKYGDQTAPLPSRDENGEVPEIAVIAKRMKVILDDIEQEIQYARTVNPQMAMGMIVVRDKLLKGLGLK